ncbi:MAG: KH domain-containing protein [bacterium]
MEKWKKDIKKEFFNLERRRKMISLGSLLGIGKRKKEKEKEEEVNNKIQIPDLVSKKTEELLRLMNFDDVVVSSKTEGDDVIITELKCAKEEENVLIGREGKTLEAIQHIVSKILSKEIEEGKKLRININNFREKNEQNIQELAYKLANEVTKFKKRTVTEPMNPRDRRIFHMTLRSNNKIKAESFGKGFFKRIAVYPQRENGRGRGFEKEEKRDYV